MIDFRSARVVTGKRHLIAKKQSLMQGRVGSECKAARKASMFQVILLHWEDSMLMHGLLSVLHCSQMCLLGDRDIPDELHVSPSR